MDAQRFSQNKSPAHITIIPRCKYIAYYMDYYRFYYGKWETIRLKGNVPLFYHRTFTIIEKAQLTNPFNCYADAYPPAKYYWRYIDDGSSSRNGSKVGGSGGGESIRAGAELAFRHAVYRGQSGTYMCTAYNDLGNAKASAKLIVLFPPQCRLRKEVGPDGRSLNLRCDVMSAYPAGNFTYRWQHDGRLLPSASGPSVQLSSRQDVEYYHYLEG